MVSFLIITLFFWIGNAAFAKVLHFSTQQDQWMDDLFGWQNMVERFGSKPGTWNKILFKALGGCEFCFAHAVSFTCFWIYAIIMICAGYWPLFESIASQWLFNISWYVVYVSTGTTISSLTINRL